MTMHEILNVILTFLEGVALGLFFFGGLWFTVRKIVAVKMPALWFLLSFFLRVSCALIGFHYISMGSWQGLIIGLIGFIAARYAAIYLTKSIE